MYHHSFNACNNMGSRFVGSGYRIFSVFFGVLLSFAGLRGSTVSFTFYGAVIELSYDPDRLPHSRLLPEESSLIRGWRWTERQLCEQLLYDLHWYKDQLQLNDWFYYKLIEQAVGQLLPPSRALQRRILTAALLYHSGYDIRLVLNHRELFVYVYAAIPLYEVSQIEDAGRSFFNLQAIGRPTPGGRSLVIMLSEPCRQGRSFDFSLDAWPALPERPVSRRFSFVYQGADYPLSLTYDASRVDLLNTYPVLDEINFIRASLSESLSSSLLPQLKTYMQEMTQREQLSFLAALCRTGFAYGEIPLPDGRQGQKSMVADELFYYQESDCEDRTALYFNLLKELLDLPLLVIAWEDHVSLAVGLQDADGDYFTHQGQRYFYCDPTGPVDSPDVCIIPFGYEGLSFTIVGEYQPQ